MTKLLYSPAAQNDLEKIGDYIVSQLQNPSAALGTIRKIYQTIDALKSFPQMGTLLNLDAGTIVYRYLTCRNYMIFYHLTEDAILIDRILYGRRDYTALLFGNNIQTDSQTE